MRDVYKLNSERNRVRLSGSALDKERRRNGQKHAESLEHRATL